MFHLLIFEAACLASCAPYPIEKSPWEVSNLCKNELCQKMDDHIVYFYKID